MALLELATQPALVCSKLIICLDRTISTFEMTKLLRDLGWVGFELTTLAPWNGGVDETSKEWLMLEMET